jgi:hypothetical protein
MHSSPGLVSQVFAALGDINVRMVSQGASRTSLSFVIPEADTAKVVSRLHAAFFSADLRRRTKKPKLQSGKSRSSAEPATSEDLLTVSAIVG